MISDSLTKEAGALKNEIHNKNVALEAEKHIFATRMANGLGEEIKTQVKNPEKPSKWVVFKIKVRLFMRRLLEM